MYSFSNILRRPTLHNNNISTTVIWPRKCLQPNNRSAADPQHTVRLGLVCILFPAFPYQSGVTIVSLFTNHSPRKTVSSDHKMLLERSLSSLPSQHWLTKLNADATVLIKQLSHIIRELRVSLKAVRTVYLVNPVFFYSLFYWLLWATLKHSLNSIHILFVDWCWMSSRSAFIFHTTIFKRLFVTIFDSLVFSSIFRLCSPSNRYLNNRLPNCISWSNLSPSFNTQYTSHNFKLHKLFTTTKLIINQQKSADKLNQTNPNIQ